MIIDWICALLGLYALVLIIYFALPYLMHAQQPWMAVLARICEPGVKIGNQAAARLFPNRRFKAEIGAVVAAVLCLIIRLVLDLFF